MLRGAIKGFDKIFRTEIPKGFVILVTGTPGTLKSGFVQNVLSNYLSEKDEFGLYVTLEETEESLLRNMASLGIKKSEKLRIFDYEEVREEFREEEVAVNIAKVTEGIIKFFKEKEGGKFTCLAVDSLSALEALTSAKYPRKEIYHFFNTLRKSGLTSFVTLETNSASEIYGPEYFLADGVIDLGRVETKGDVIRYIQVVKMRATEHSMAKHQLVVEKGGLAVRGPTYER